MIDFSQELKLKLLKSNLKQDWNLDNEFWNEEFEMDYRYQDTYLQLSHVFNTFSNNELNRLIILTKSEKKLQFNIDLKIEINNYIKSCVKYINYELDGNIEEYFKKFKNNSYFHYEKNIKFILKSLM